VISNSQFVCVCFMDCRTDHFCAVW